jgi:hypothetical protein
VSGPAESSHEPGMPVFSFQFNHLLSDTLSLCEPQFPHQKVWINTSCHTLKQLRAIGEGDQELEKRLDEKELT